MGIFVPSGRSLAQGVSALLTLFLETPCPLCDRSSSEPLCRACQKQLDQSHLPEPLTYAGSTLPLVAWGTYQGTLRQALRALKYDQLKYEQKVTLAHLLGEKLGHSWHQVSHQLPGFSSAIAVPIPLHADKLRQRGFNQAELLAQGFCRATGLPLVAEGLVRHRATTAQHGLGAKARQQNLAGAFAVGRSLLAHRNPTPVLLIDDIYTTGATIEAAAQTLTQQGIPVVGVGVVARGAVASSG